MIRPFGEIEIPFKGKLAVGLFLSALDSIQPILNKEPEYAIANPL
jgi:hypothetical protein